MNWLMRMLPWKRRPASPAAHDAKARLEKVQADDSTVDKIVAHRARLASENGLAHAIERALRARRT